MIKCHDDVSDNWSLKSDMIINKRQKHFPQKCLQISHRCTVKTKINPLLLCVWPHRQYFPQNKSIYTFFFQHILTFTSNSFREVFIKKRKKERKTKQIKCLPPKTWFFPAHTESRELAEKR